MEETDSKTKMQGGGEHKFFFIGNIQEFMLVADTNSSYSYKQDSSKKKTHVHECGR